jgi:hypothetical protein
MNVKISTLVDQNIWNEVKLYSKENHISLSGMISEALKEHLFKKRLRPEFLKHLEKSIDENQKLGQLLAE